MDTFDLLVVFKDGSEMVIEGVWDYEIKKDILSVKKGGYASLSTMVNPIVDWTDENAWDFLEHYGCKSNPLFNWSEVKYCGRLSDLR